MGRKGKIIMKLVLKNGQIKEVDTSVMLSNQYNTTDGNRAYDNEVKHIIDDIRLGEFYWSSVKQGTYDEVAQAIKEERSKIDQCATCRYFNRQTLLRDESGREEVIEGNRRIVTEKSVYEISCGYIPSNGQKCIHDIADKPILFREKYHCFFCEHPQGVPNMSALKMFMCANAEQYAIVPHWSCETLGVNNSFKCGKMFGSYTFEANYHSDFFELSNARNHFRFYVDLENKKFILCDGIGYEIAKDLGVKDYDWNAHDYVRKPIRGYEKFAKWLWKIVDDFNETK